MARSKPATESPKKSIARRTPLPKVSIGLSLAVPQSSATLTFAKESSGNSRGRKPKPEQTNDIDNYILLCPTEAQQILRQIREVIREAAPDAHEVISYGMPAFRQHGILVYFAAWKKHIGFYPPISGDAAIEKAVAKYAGPKGNLQFPLDEPIPYALIKRIVKLRVKQDSDNHEAKRAKRRKKS